MGLISFKWNTNYLICPILMGISFGIRYTFTNKISGSIHFLIFSLVMFFGQFSCFIFEIILKKRSKSNSQEVVNVQYNQFIERDHCTIRWDFLLLFCASFLDLLSFSILGYVKNIGTRHDESIDSLSFALRMTQTLFLTGLTKLILKIQLFKHNIMAIIIIFIGITALVIMNIYSDSWGIFGIYILGYFLNALRISIIKILLDKWYYSTYKLLFIIGSIGIFLVVLIMPFSLLIKSGTFTFKSIYVNSFQIFKYEKISILYIVIVYLMGLLFNVSGTLTNHRLSSSHVGIGDTLAGLILIIIFKLNDIVSLIISFFISLIILLACLIYTEIIVIDCCGLKHNTVTEIFQRRVDENTDTEDALVLRETGISLVDRRVTQRKNIHEINHENQDINNINVLDE